MVKDFKRAEKNIWSIVKDEEIRQAEGLELIPSENYASQEVLKALGTVFTNKYSEGYPGKRYYGGQENTDLIENICIQKAEKLFKCDHANVQPYSGSPANLAVYSAWANPGDTILSMNLSHGGHLTHGSPLTFSSKIYKFIHYGIKNLETGEIDYDEMEELALKYKPKIIVAGYSSYPRELDYEKISKIANKIGAVAMADIAHIAGLVAAGVLKNPFAYGFHVCTSTTHKTLRGPRGGLILSKGVVSNPLSIVEKKIENLPTLIDRAVFPGIQGGPHMNVILAKAIAFEEASSSDFKEYSNQIIKNSKYLADKLMEKGFKIITNGTDNHIILIDMIKSFNISGGNAEKIFDSIGLTTNKNVIPNDTRKPFDPSGIRIGTPAVTTRGMKEKDMEIISQWMFDSITHSDNEVYLKKLRLEVVNYCKKFPIPK
ncbi:serine hydroxymethyltransferase [Patescibacteria group bacterium]|nr:serine hydroxymethyltransferase [Patescibacteria group bacterium]